MAYVRKATTGSIQVKSGRLAAVINLYDAENNRKRRSVDTGLNPRNGKTQAKEFLRRLLDIINDRKYISLSDRMIDIIDKCNKSYKGVFDADCYIAMLEEIVEEKRAQAPMLRSSISPEMPFVDFLNLWLKTKTKIQDNTYDGYNQAINGRIAEFFNAIGSTISNLKPENFEDYYDFLRVNYNLTDCTALHHHRLMKQALSYGVKKGPLMYNIMDKVDAPDDSDFQGDYYRASEALELLEKAKGDTLYIVVLLTTFYGFRRSEVLGLRWTAIDFEANVINVERKIVVTSRHGKREYQDKKKMKSQSSRRTLPLIDIVREALLIEKKKQEEYKKAFGKAYHDNKEGYICVDPLGKLITPDYVTGHFEVLLRKSKMRKIRFHDLRHTCATLLVMNGVSLLLVSRWLGHSNMAVTEKYYLHFDVKSQIESAVKMGQILPHQLAEDVVQTFLHG